MSAVLDFIKNIFAFHKKRIFLFFVACFAFFLLLFPMEDLSDWVTGMVTAQTNNSVYLQFDDLSLALLPQPGVKMNNVVVESAAMPELEMEALSVAPSLLQIHKLIQQHPRGRAYAQNLFGGDLDLSASGSSKLKTERAVSIDVDFENFDVKKLFRALKTQVNIPFVASGQGQLEADIDFDQRMSVQPDGSFQLNIIKARIPAFSIPLGQMGELPMPSLDMDRLVVKGQIKNGRLNLQEVLLGSNKNELFGKISGDLDIQLSPGMRSRLGLYNFAIDLSMSKAIKSQLSILEPFIGKFQRKTLSGTRYTFRVKGRAVMGDFPKFTNM